MINALLKAKHWQLFLIMFALPLMAYFGVMGSFFTSIIGLSMQMEPTEEPDPEMIFAIFDQLKWFYLLAMLPLLLHSLWQWSISVGLHDKLPSGHGMNLNLFKWFMILSVAMLFAVLYLAADSMDSFVEFARAAEDGEVPDDDVIKYFGRFFMIIPLSLISAVFTLYCHYFTGKTIKMIEHGDKPGKPESIGEFFLIWFYYIGVWFIQPRVNRIVEGNINPDEHFTTDRAS